MMVKSGETATRSTGPDDRAPRRMRVGVSQQLDGLHVTARPADWSSTGAPRGASVLSRSSTPDTDAGATGSIIRDMMTFVLPAMSFVEVAMIGRMIVSELLMAAALPWLLGTRTRIRIPPWFAALWLTWLVGQVVTDIAAGSDLNDLSRGWATILFTMTNILAVCCLVTSTARMRLFAAGLAVAGVGTFWLSPGLFPPDDPWKWGYAMPVALGMAAIMSGGLALHRPWVAVAAIGAVGVVNLAFNYRSLAGIALLAASYLALNAIARQAESPVTSRLRPLRAAVLGLVVACTVFALYTGAASSGLLGADAQAKYNQQSGSMGVLVGGRSESLASLQAFVDSPILGHGSWARDFKYVDLLMYRLDDLGYDEPQIAAIASEGLIPTHSYILGAAVHAGLAGFLFWAGSALAAVWLLLNIYVHRLAWMPLLSLVLVNFVWAIAFSPYANSARIAASFAIALCFAGYGVLRSDVSRARR